VAALIVRYRTPLLEVTIFPARPPGVIRPPVMVFESDSTFNVRPALRSATSFSGARPRNPNRRSIPCSGDRAPVDQRAPSLVISVPSRQIHEQPAEYHLHARRSRVTDLRLRASRRAGRTTLPHPAASGDGRRPRPGSAGSKGRRLLEVAKVLGYGDSR
jgi:hypothetical protein